MAGYTSIPTLDRWRSDSSVVLAVRKADPILHRIDGLIAAYHEASASCANGIVCDLYFSIDYWLRSVKTNRNMAKGREPAMAALYRCVVNLLCGAFGCQVSTLPRELDLMFGRELSELGFRFDVEYKKARYLERKALEAYRIWFRAGKAYQFTTPPLKAGRQLLHSANLHNPDAFVRAEGQAENAGYGAFILTLDRRFYMARHMPGEANKFNGFYHSSYVAGQTVMAAGSMLIEHGRVRRMRSDSGHYKPTDTNMLAALQALRMLGVAIQDVWVEDFKGLHPVLAPEFLKASGNWSKLSQNRDDNLKLRKELYRDKERVRNPRPAPMEALALVDTPYGDD